MRSTWSKYKILVSVSDRVNDCFAVKYKGHCRCVGSTDFVKPQ